MTASSSFHVLIATDGSPSANAADGDTVDAILEEAKKVRAQVTL